MTEPSPGVSQPLRVLVPLDGSPEAEVALAAATRLAPGRIILLHVEGDSGFLLPDIDVGDDERMAEMRTNLEHLAEPLRTNNREVVVDVRSGDPAEHIVDAARAVDLIVMTTHGRGAAGRAIFGSVADRVSRSSDTPAMLIRTGVDHEIVAPSRVVVPLDGSATGERALPLAARLAQVTGCPLHLVRAIDLDDVRATIHDQRVAGIDTGGQSLDDARAETERRALAYLESQRDVLEANGIAVEVKLLEGTPSFTLLWEIAETDLVVMSSHGRGGYRRWLLGSVAEKLVREAKAPVVLVPTRDTADEGT